MSNQYITAGENYLKSCVFHGLAHSYDVVKKKYVKPYPEVTGYIVKYFCNNYQELPANIVKAGNNLVRIQDKETGGFSTFNCKSTLFAFDTSQILIGLAAIYNKTNKIKYKKAAIKAGDFLLMMQQENGSIAPTYDKKNKKIIADDSLYAIWNGPWSGLMCKLTEGFQALYELTMESKYLDAKKKAADFYVNADYIECTHPLGYWLEGLYEGGKFDKVDQILREKVIPRIRENGYIPYKENLGYAYVSGTVQLGIILFKRGFIEDAKKIREYGRLVQSKHTTGGIFQYADEDGNLDKHVHTEINSWGTKYFCELEALLENK